MSGIPEFHNFHHCWKQLFSHGDPRLLLLDSCRVKPAGPDRWIFRLFFFGGEFSVATTLGAFIMMIEGPERLEFFQGFPINVLKRFHEQMIGFSESPLSSEVISRFKKYMATYLWNGWVTIWNFAGKTVVIPSRITQVLGWFPIQVSTIMKHYHRYYEYQYSDMTCTSYTMLLVAHDHYQWARMC